MKVAMKLQVVTVRRQLVPFFCLFYYMYRKIALEKNAKTVC